MSKEIPIFIVGSERSGSNLLRTLLGNHSQVDAPVSPHFLDAFIPILSKIGDLRNQNIKVELLVAMLELANHAYNDWQLEYTKELDEELKECTGFMDLFHLVYKKKAQKEGKVHYVSKDIHIFKYTFKILAKLPNAKLLFLYRDPRDHTASWMRTPLFMHTPFQVVQKWNREQSICLDQMNKYGIEMYPVSYEEMIQDPKQKMSDILSFIGLPIESACFETNRENNESKRNELWKNLSKPILKENKKKWHKYLREKDLRVVESVAKANMMELGYTYFETDASWEWKRGRFFGTGEKLRAKWSKWRHRNFIRREMELLQDKIKILSELRNRLLTKRSM